MMAKHIKVNDFIEVKLGSIGAYIFVINVKDILPIYYVAVRGQTNEEGAVQRILNKRRISSIKDFVLDGNMFFNAFILNWTDKNHDIKFNDEQIHIPITSNAAQVIDGQHRLEGLKAAYEEDHTVGDRKAIIMLTQKISTKDAANIFLNINTEQKPVPSSLVYDLFGEVRDPNFFIVRATDISKRLHEDKDSPYYSCLKIPGIPRAGKVDLSTMVNAIKQLTCDDGVFSEYNLNDFELQYKVICNFFKAIKYFYDEEGNWLKSTNPFMTNAGCHAGIDFLNKDLIAKCAQQKSFAESAIRELIPLSSIGLMFREDLKNKDGKEQRKLVYQYLKNSLLRDVPKENEYKF